MIGLKVDGQYLKLPSGIQFNWELLHPSFSENLLGGGYSFPIEIDRCEENDLILNFPSDFHYIDDAHYERDVVIEKHGSMWRTGKLIIDRPGTRRIGGYLRIGLQSLSVLDKNLEDIDYGGDVSMGATQLEVENYVQGVIDSGDTWPGVGIYFPMIKNGEFYGDANPDFEGYINAVEIGTGVLKVNRAVAPAPSNINCLVPMPFFLTVLQSIFEEAGYEFIEDSVLFGQINLYNKTIWNNVALDLLGDTNYNVYAGAPFTVTTHYQGINSHFICNDDSTPGFGFYDPNLLWEYTTSEYQTVVSGAHRVAYKFEYVTSNTVSAVNGVIVRLVIMVNGVEKWRSNDHVSYQANQRFSFQDTATISVDPGEVGLSLYIEVQVENTNVVGWGGTIVSVATTGNVYIKIDPLENAQVNIYQNSFNIRNHVPDMTVREYLKAFMDEHNVTFHVDEVLSRVRMISNKARLQVTNATDYTTKASPDHDPFANVDRIKSISYDWPSDDAYVEGNFKDYDRNNSLGSFAGVGAFPANPVAGQTARDSNTNVRYVAVNAPGTATIEWQYLRDDYEEYVFDSSYENELKLKFPPLFCIYDDDLGINIGRISQQGSSEAFGLGITRSAPRSMVINGSYPHTATPTNALIELQSGSPVEMLLRQWSWLQLRNGRFIWEKMMRLEADDIEALSTYPGGIEDPIRIDNMHFIIRNISITEDVAGIAGVKFQLMRLS